MEYKIENDSDKAIAICLIILSISGIIYFTYLFINNKPTYTHQGYVLEGENLTDFLQNHSFAIAKFPNGQRILWMVDKDASK